MAQKPEIIEKIVTLYRSIARHPAVVSGRILKSESDSCVKIESTWSQRNLEKKEVTAFKKFHVLSASTELFTGHPVDVSSEQLSQYSRSERFRSVLREGGLEKDDGKKKQFLEIWESDFLYKNFDVDAFDVHGTIYSDGEFGSLEWSPDESKVLYIAEKKAVKSQPYYAQKSEDSMQTTKEPSCLGEEFVYKPDWGEQLVDKHQPVIGICDLKAETLNVLQGVPSNFSPGQVIWSNNGEGVFGVALENEPRRLGLIYCTNRKGFIFYLGLNGKFELLSESNKSVRSPRLSPDGNYLFWLQRPSGGPHDGCQELVKYDISSKKASIVIPIIRKPSDFCGIYSHRLPKRCFSKDGKKLFFSTPSKTKIVSYCVNVDTGKVEPIKIDESASILDIFNDMILITTSTMQNTPSVKLCKSLTTADWIALTKSTQIVKDSIVKHMEFSSEDEKDDFRYFNGLYFGPAPHFGREDKRIPLMVFPHGGPHGCSTDSFSIEGTLFVSLGFGVLYVNYRGSTGAGQDSVDFLPGKVGDSDVKDNHNAMMKVLQEVPCIDPKKIVLSGGSHGGFLVIQLSAQYPETYKAVVARNPVIDIYSMYTASDIPDWCSVESGFPFDESTTITIDRASTMLRKSPIHGAGNIKAPTLLMIGKKDLRVPFNQGLYLYNTLKARNVKTRLNVYDDNHPLGQVPVHMDAIINAALWFMDHLDTK